MGKRFYANVKFGSIGLKCVRKLHYCAYSTFIFEVTHEEITLTCRYIYLYNHLKHQVEVYFNIKLLKMKAKTLSLFRILTKAGYTQPQLTSPRNSSVILAKQGRQISQSSSSSAIPN